MFHRSCGLQRYAPANPLNPFLRACLLALMLCNLSVQISEAGSRDFDPTERVNANLIDVFVTNYGSFAHDAMNNSPGLVYPNGTGRTAVYSSGLWMGALVDGELRVSVAEYFMTYGPGPITETGQWADPEDDRYRTYKIAPGDLPWSNPDYAEWPVEDGAPLGEDGYPRIIGDQMLWSVYNDLNPALRYHDIATDLPLEIEVRQTSFADFQYGTAERTVFLEWKVINKNLESLSDAYISIWMDPDLGDGWDDLVGCDSLLSLGYCYNATNDDPVYGPTPPAIGGVVLQGPIVPSLGDSAYVSGEIVFDHKNLPMTAFSRYINGTDPYTPEQVYNYMRGFTAAGDVIIDPTTGLPTSYVMAGDPVTGDGWIDTNPSDRRMLLSAGPFEMAPGDSQIVAVAMIVGQGPDRLASITNLKEHASEAPTLFRVLVEAPQPPPLPPLDWSWSPDPRWLTGVDWGGSTFFGGIGFGDQWFGSTLDESDYVEVEVRFDSLENTICARYDRNLDYAWVGTGIFRGSAYDISNPNDPRRLNICFVESSMVDGLWEPDTSSTGGREYLYIMNSDYNGGADYGDENWGLAADVLYGAWLRLRPYRVFLETDPAFLKLVFPLSTTEDERLPVAPDSNSDRRILLRFATSPNPVRLDLSLAFELARPAPVTISILDASGRLVERPISNRPYGPGSHRLDWVRTPGTNGLPSGVYFWRIQVGSEVLSRRVVMLR